MLLKTELLNRMEILFPEEPRFNDLRRAYIDRDLASVFRLIEGGANVEEFRKFVLGDNEWSLYRLILDIRDTQIVRTIKSFQASDVRWDKDAMSQGQLASKMWLIRELQALDLELGTVFLCAGWYGLLAVLLFENGLQVDRVRSFDIDPTVVDIADKFNLPWFSDSWRFKAITADIHTLNFSSHDWTSWSNSNNRMSYPITDVPNTIINTSCEHIEDFESWYARIPDGKLVVLQSNDFQDIQEHVNISPDLDSFADKTPLAEVLYSGKLNLTAYNRFMRIGYR
jgi:hypothetical protein